MSFSKISQKCSHAVGTSWGFFSALTLIIAWALSGPLFSFSETWQLLINTTTTIITFVMVFLIQNSQNHDTKAMHEKLDEIIINMESANNKFARIERLDEEAVDDLDKLHDDHV